MRKIKLAKVLKDILTMNIYFTKKQIEEMNQEPMIKVTAEQRKRAQQAVFARDVYARPCSLLVVNDSDYDVMKSFCN